MKKYCLLVIALTLSGCEKPNTKPTFGETGLPMNCRAVIQANIDEIKKIRESDVDFRLQMIKIDDHVDSMERNCGANGYSWEYK